MDKEKTLNASESKKDSCKLNARNGRGQRASVAASPLFELADRLKSLKDEKKQKELELKNLSDMIFDVDAALSEFMTFHETQNFTRSGMMFCLTTSTKASAVSGKKDELYTTLKDAGYGDLVQETVNVNSLSSFVKEQILENENVLPEWLDGLVNVFEKTTVGVRKATK